MLKASSMWRRDKQALRHLLSLILHLSIYLFMCGESQFSHFTMWVLGIKLIRKGLYQLNHFTGL